MVGIEGFEPSRYFYQQILSLVRSAYFAISPYKLGFLLSDNPKPTHPKGGWQVKGAGNSRATVPVGAV